MARSSRTYRAEYAARKRRGEEAGVPLSVARGHGPIPMRLARRLEAQKAGTSRRPIPRATIARYGAGIREYEREWWGGFVTGVGRVKALPYRFPSRQLAEEFIDEMGYGTIPRGYITIQQRPAGDWVLLITRGRRGR